MIKEAKSVGQSEEEKEAAKKKALEEAVEKAREEVVRNREIWSIKKPNWYKNYAKKEAARCKKSTTCMMAAKGIKKLERIYKNKWMNTPYGDY